MSHVIKIGNIGNIGTKIVCQAFAENIPWLINSPRGCKRKTMISLMTEAEAKLETIYGDLVSFCCVSKSKLAK